MDEKPKTRAYYPPQPTTKPLPKVEVPQNQLDALLLEVRISREEQAATREELRAMRSELQATIERTAKHSDGVRQLSQTNETQDETITGLALDLQTVKSDVNELKASQTTQLEILRRLDKIAANPIVRRVAYAAGVGLLAWFKWKGYL